jgi:hypothetical protein
MISGGIPRIPEASNMSDINTAVVDRLKALDPNRPIREEADM